MNSKLTFVGLLFLVSNVTANRCEVIHPPTAIDCSGLGMDTLPEHLKNYIAIIMKFSHNKLNSTISFNDWPNLRSVDVSYNSIKNVSEMTFKDLINLKVLNISYNGLEVISENALDNLEVLEVLDLSGNTDIGDDFSSLQKLLNGTLYRSLKKLVMRSCELVVLPESFFHHALELQHLDLSRNNLTHIPMLPTSLIHLDLSSNFITTISIVPFHNTHKLKNLFLDYNKQLSIIDNNAFEMSRNLKNVSFRGCENLTSLPPNLFYFNKNLKHLSIADCNLKTLPKQFRHSFLKIPSLELEGNPWICNASIKWFITLGSPIIDNIRCHEPINNTIMEYYGTNYHHSALRQLLIALIFTVLILFGVAIYVAFSKEQKRRLHTPYLPLQGKHPFHNPVYITTVV